MRAQFISPPTHYRVETVATPHSRHRAFIDVISPQAGHILWDRAPVICGINLRIHRNSSVMRSRASRPKEILVAFIESDLSLASSASTCQLRKIAADKRRADGPLAEKPKVEELQDGLA